MLILLEQPMTAEEAAAESRQPLFKVRSSLREMLEAGLVAMEGFKYKITERGRQMAKI